jgi:hypothetical protein
VGSVVDFLLALSYNLFPLNDKQEHTMCKSQNMLTDILFKHHPDFHCEVTQKVLLKHHRAVNGEHLVEQAMAAVGGYEFVDGAHYDFSDGTECKTGSIRPSPTKPGRNTYAGEISNVVSSGGVQKSGDVRFVLWNPHRARFEYFYIPHAHLGTTLKINTHGTNGTGRIFFTWNQTTDVIAKLEPFRVRSFHQLATIRAGSFTPVFPVVATV